MAAGAGAGGAGAMALQAFREMPPVTKVYVTSCALTTAAVQLDLASPLQLYLHPGLVAGRFQLWRLVTNFLFFGYFGFAFIFNVAFTYRYCRLLETNHYRGRTADFVVMFVFGMSLMTLLGLWFNIIFLGQAFTIMLVYIWSRRNPLVGVNFFGILSFTAPYLPWVLTGFSILTGNSVAVDLVGIGVGHLYYYLEDVFPKIPGGRRILRTPDFLKRLCDPAPEDPDYNPPPEERPGGFDWGNRRGRNLPDNPDGQQRPRDQGPDDGQD